MPYKDPEKKLECDHRYREKNHDEILARHQVYNKTNREKVNEQNHAWRVAHPDKNSRHHTKYRSIHHEAILERAQKWREINIDKAREYTRKRNHVYRARKKGNGGSFTFEELNARFEEQEGFCFYCGELLYKSFDRNIHIEHKIPIVRGGPNNISNIVLSCAKCNYSKHTKTADEFIEYLENETRIP